MIIRRMIMMLTTLSASTMMFNASANSVGFDAMEYDGTSGTISVTISYDFSEFAMFGGGLDVIFDSEALEFVSYTQAELASDAWAPGSPVGMLTGPGIYSGPGVGGPIFFTGMTSVNDIGTFVFNVLGGGSGTTPCGETLCLQANAFNPFVSLAGDDVSAQLLGNGFSSAVVSINPVPIPAAVWFMLSGVGALYGFGRKTV